MSEANGVLVAEVVLAQLAAIGLTYDRDDYLGRFTGGNLCRPEDPVAGRYRRSRNRRRMRARPGPTSTKVVS